MSFRRLALIVAIISLVAAVWWRSHSNDNARRGFDGGDARVLLTQSRSDRAPVYLTAMGNVVSPHVVNVRPQVSGTLKEIYFEEGRDVAAGDKLFLIDPAPYQAALAQARAQLAVDRAALSAARAQFERMKPLAEKEYVTSQEFDDARAAADEAAARVVADEAAVQTAEINLGYTLIRAPIAGRTGSIRAKVGNLVSSNDSTPLVVINELDTVQVQFAIPQTDLARVQQALTQGDVAVEVFGSDLQQPLAKGRLQFIENTIDTSTGTVSLKAVVDNRDHRLWPGAFVSVRLQLAVENAAVLVPESAVQPGAAGPYVFVVDEESRAQVRTVTVDRQVGSELVIREGLKAGETIIAKAPQNLQPGSKVVDAQATVTPAQKDGTGRKP